MSYVDIFDISITIMLYYLNIWDSFSRYICLFICIFKTTCDYQMWEFIVFGYYDSLQVFLSNIRF
jgi:hypothetical protein